MLDIVGTSLGYIGLGFMKDAGFFQMLRVSPIIFCALLSIPILKQAFFSNKNIFLAPTRSPRSDNVSLLGTKLSITLNFFFHLTSSQSVVAQQSVSSRSAVSQQSVSRQSVISFSHSVSHHTIGA